MSVEYSIRCLVFVINPTVHAVAAGCCCLFAGMRIEQGIVLALVVGCGVLLTGWLDFCREHTAEPPTALASQQFLARELVVLVLPYFFALGWLALATLSDTALNARHMVIAVISGIFVSRMAIEQHYRRRPRRTKPKQQDLRTVYVYEDRQQ